MPISFTVKSPSQCSSDEIDEFAKFVRDGGQVASAGLQEIIQRSQFLLFGHDHDGSLAAIGALKNPRTEYRQKVFQQKARSSLSATDFPLELGWAYVAAAYRGQGLGQKIIHELIQAAAGSAIYATTGNPAMHRYLKFAGFTATGSPYHPEQGAADLTLYVYQPAHH